MTTDTITTPDEVIAASNHGSISEQELYLLMRLLGYRLFGDVGGIESTAMVN